MDFIWTRSHPQHFFSDKQTTGSDYVLDSSPRGLAQMTKAEKLKLIFEALDKKNKEMNKGKG